MKSDKLRVVNYELRVKIKIIYLFFGEFPGLPRQVFYTLALYIGRNSIHILARDK
jgi:hypothetical protein